MPSMHCTALSVPCHGLEAGICRQSFSSQASLYGVLSMRVTWGISSLMCTCIYACSTSSSFHFTMLSKASCNALSHHFWYVLHILLGIQTRLLCVSSVCRVCNTVVDWATILCNASNIMQWTVAVTWPSWEISSYHCTPFHFMSWLRLLRWQTLHLQKV